MFQINIISATEGNMMCQVLLFVFALGAMQGVLADLDSSMNCSNLYHTHSTYCCKQRYINPRSFADIKECFHNHKLDMNYLLENSFKEEKIHRSCEMHKCIAEKRGYLTKDNNIDEDALKKEFEIEFFGYPKLIDKIKNNCSEKSKLAKYGPDFVCDLVKLRFCTSYQLNNECSDWFETPKCLNVKKLVGECNID